MLVLVPTLTYMLKFSEYTSLICLLAEPFDVYS